MINKLIKLCGGYTKEEFDKEVLNCEETKELLSNRYNLLSDDMNKKDKRIAELTYDCDILRDETLNVIKSNKLIKKEKNDFIAKTRDYAKKCEEVMQANKIEIESLKKATDIDEDNCNLDEYISLLDPTFENEDKIED